MIGSAGGGRSRATWTSTPWGRRCGGEPPDSAICVRNPGNPAKADSLIRELSRFLFAGFAINAVRIDFAIVDAPGFFRKALADVIAVGLDLPPHFDQRGAELCRRDRRGNLPRSAEARRHYRF